MLNFCSSLCKQIQNLASSYDLVFYFSHCKALLNDNNSLVIQSKRLQEILSK